MRIELHSEQEQENFGAHLAATLPLSARPVIYLQGDLGSGKTTLVRGLLRSLGWQGPVKSPTYTFVETYSMDAFTVSHFDLYRLGDATELEYLGLRELAGEHMLIFEWPERGENELPTADVWVHFSRILIGRRLVLEAVSGLGKEIVTTLQSLLQTH